MARFSAWNDETLELKCDKRCNQIKWFEQWTTMNANRLNESVDKFMQTLLYAYAWWIEWEMRLNGWLNLNEKFELTQNQLWQSLSHCKHYPNDQIICTLLHVEYW